MMKAEKLMKNTRCCMSILFICTICSAVLCRPAVAANRLPTPDEYYLILREIAEKEYKGRGFDATLQTGYTFSYGDTTSEYIGDSGMIMTSSASGNKQSRHNVGANITIPLFSKEERLAQRQKVIDFLQQGTELIQKLELAIRTREIQIETLTVLNETAKEGVQGALAIKDMQVEIVRQETLIKQYHRDIQSLINPFKEGLNLTIGSEKFSFSEAISVSFE